MSKKQVIKEIGYYRCLTLLDKYYGHQNHRIGFANKEHRIRNADALAKGQEDLLNNYTTEEIEVEFILD